MLFPSGLTRLSLRVINPHNSIGLLGIVPSIRRSSLIHHWNIARFQSSLQKKDDSKGKKEISADAYEKQQIIKRRIPGESVQTNTWKDRFPSSWHFEREASPTLLPRPGVPPPNKYPLAKMFQMLRMKKQPEIIYEAEPHKLYFVFCYAFAFVFIFYAVNALTIGKRMSDQMYTENANNLPSWKLKMEYAMHFVTVTVLGCLPLAVGIGFLLLPTRLIRRMWYLPEGAGKGAYVRFTTHPLLPNRPTPVHTMSIDTLKKSITAKIYTGKGFYGANDPSFFFFLRENGRKVPYLVDRKGFIWGDARIFDLLFSNDTIDQVEKSRKIDEVYGDMLRERRKNEQKLKKEYGFGWRTKATGKIMADDISKIQNILKKGNSDVPASKTEEPEKNVSKSSNRKKNSKKGSKSHK